MAGTIGRSGRQVCLIVDPHDRRQVRRVGAGGFDPLDPARPRLTPASAAMSVISSAKRPAPTRTTRGGPVMTRAPAVAGATSPSSGSSTTSRWPARATASRRVTIRERSLDDRRELLGRALEVVGAGHERRGRDRLAHERAPAAATRTARTPVKLPGSRCTFRTIRARPRRRCSIRAVQAALDELGPDRRPQRTECRGHDRSSDASMPDAASPRTGRRCRGLCHPRPAARPSPGDSR